MITDLLHPLLLGLDWMDPEWLLDKFGQEMFWVSILIVFVECGLLFPILPGDSLLFSVGLFIHRAGAGEAGIDVNIVVACVLLSLAALLGNITGYEIGRAIGPKVYEHRGRFLKQEHFTKTELFFEKHGAKALVLGRFVPIVRTFITLVAGVGRMDRRHFFLWSAIGAVLWATGITLLGYFLGGIEFLQHNIEAAILVIVAISVLPMVFEWWRHRKEAAAAIDEVND
ncbi:VTT domain-containing protein [Nocardioides sp. JQ2195]|uniref:DedA family protein n=1 Tax=Nocardioides sp. JQ2195 TaxID=2592334 RepID=UPI001F10BF55|nr:VTT domain-containing protein [Nocardioides sp. JQ2195]